jgi:hypothetical protein
MFCIALQMVQYFSQVHWYSGLSHWTQRTGPAGIAVSSKKTLPERGALRQECVFRAPTNVSKLEADHQPEAQAGTISGTGSGPQQISARGPTKNVQDKAPSSETNAVTARATVKRPVHSTTNPVRAGPITPAKLAKPFCKPTQRPAVRGPARIWAQANIPEPNIPEPRAMVKRVNK